ncbi:MAG TPA: hypothetical protein EYP34_13685, partial [Chromatiaceae bacterium]|nr:hypothetical protein [Chromatiaceae bacterium]
MRADRLADRLVIMPEPQERSKRLMRLYFTYRVILAIGLLMFSSVGIGPSFLGTNAPDLHIITVLTYLVLAIASLMLSFFDLGSTQVEYAFAMLGQPVSMLIPEVIGFKLTGAMKEGTTATDLVLTVVQMLRAKGVVGKFVEFYGPGLDHLTLADQATIGNMAPEYGATCGIFPVDEETIRYLSFTGRDPERVALVEAYAKAQGMWRDASTPDPVFTDTLELDLGTVEPSLAGPKRPQDRVPLSGVSGSAEQALADMGSGTATPIAGSDDSIEPADVVIAAITSCTNTSNPSVLVGAGLLAKKAREK